MNQSATSIDSGDPLSDLSYMCMLHYLPSSAALLPGISDLDLEDEGIPEVSELVQHYCKIRK